MHYLRETSYVRLFKILTRQNEKSAFSFRIIHILLWWDFHLIPNEYTVPRVHSKAALNMQIHLHIEKPSTGPLVKGAEIARMHLTVSEFIRVIIPAWPD